MQLLEGAARPRERHLVILVDGVVADETDDLEAAADRVADGVAERPLRGQVGEGVVVGALEVLGGVDPGGEEFGSASSVRGGCPRVGA